MTQLEQSISLAQERALEQAEIDSLGPWPHDEEGQEVDLVIIGLLIFIYLQLYTTAILVSTSLYDVIFNNEWSLSCMVGVIKLQLVN